MRNKYNFGLLVIISLILQNFNISTTFADYDNRVYNYNGYYEKPYEYDYNKPSRYTYSCFCNHDCSNCIEQSARYPQHTYVRRAPSYYYNYERHISPRRPNSNYNTNDVFTRYGREIYFDRRRY